MSNAIAEIVRSVTALAAAPEEQTRYLESLQIPDYERSDGPDLRNIDELALEFEDSLLTHEALLERGDLTDQQMKCLATLDRALDRMSGEKNADLWTIEALWSKPEWGNIRNLAASCLELLTVK